jgi:ketosteroid isomerase-like protein
MHIDDPATVAEVTAAFAAYERALMDNDVDALNRFFWPSSLVVRFGPGQNLYGIDAIAAFRAARVGGSPKRTLRETRITTYGTDFATANTEFQREGGVPPGRQSQTWARLAEGWRIVSAHVSMLGEGN